MSGAGRNLFVALVTSHALVALYDRIFLLGQSFLPAINDLLLGLLLCSSGPVPRAKALALGARHIDVGQRPEEGHVVLADPDGHEFCMLTPR